MYPKLSKISGSKKSLTIVILSFVTKGLILISVILSLKIGSIKLVSLYEKIINALDKSISTPAKYLSLNVSF